MEDKRIQELASMYENHLEVKLSDKSKCNLFKYYLEYLKTNPNKRNQLLISTARGSGNTYLLKECLVFYMFEEWERNNGK